MRIVLFALPIGLAAISMASSADAQNYPWCAYYSVNGGAENCGFAEYEQCMQAIGGMGGFCARNTQYVPAAGGRMQAASPRPPYRPRTRRHRPL